MQEALRGEITKKMIVYFFSCFFLLQINVIALRFIFIIDHIKIISYTVVVLMRFLHRYYFVLHLSSKLTSRKRGLTIMPCSELWPMMYWIIDPSDKCHPFPFISLALGSAKRWCNFSVMEQCDKFTLKTCHPRRKKPALKSLRIIEITHCKMRYFLSLVFFSNKCD